MQTLTVEGVKKAARKCVYEFGSFRCAIGAALTQATLKTVHEKLCNTGAGVCTLVHKGVVNVPVEAMPELRDIQSAHDRWAQIVTKHRREESEQEFLKLIDWKGR